jgi:hypothetical protein
MREDTDNHEKLMKRGVEDEKKKPGISKPGAKKEKGKQTKKRKGNHAKKTKKQQKTGPKKKMCDNKFLEKKRLQLKANLEKLKEERSKMPTLKREQFERISWMRKKCWRQKLK